MAASVTHSFISGYADDADTSLVRPSDWNAGHVVSGVVETSSVEWVDLTDGGETSLHTHDHGALNGLGDNDHTQYLLATSYTAADVLAKLLTVDGSGSGLDADLLDGQSGAFYLDSANFTGTNWTDLTDGGATTLHSHAAGGGTIGGTIADTQVAVGTGVDTIGGSAGLISTSTGGYRLLTLSDTTGSILTLNATANQFTFNVDDADTGNEFSIKNETTVQQIFTVNGATDAITFWEGVDASQTMTFSLSGATDPQFTFANALTTISAGNLAITALTASRLVATDSSKVLVNTITAANLGSSISDLASGVATWWATPSSANLRSVLTDENGTGAALFDGASDANLTTPNISGTPNAAGERGYDSTRGIPTSYDAWGSAIGIPRVAIVAHPAETLTNSTASDQDYTSIGTIPANFLIAQRVIRVTLAYSYTTDGVASSQATYLKLGTTKVFTTNVTTPGNNETRAAVHQFLIFGTAAAGASANVDTFSAAAVNVNVWATGGNSTAQPVALATNGALAIVPGVAFGTSTNGESRTLLDAMVEILN